MNQTKIEWCDYTINPVKGLCPMACPYCYARAMYKRFKWNPEIRYTSRWNAELPWIKPSRIFIGSTIELFGDWIPTEWLEDIFLKVKLDSQHTFIFLTKQPQNLIKFSPFPDNCQIGLSVTHQGVGESNHGCSGAIPSLEDIDARVKFISFEPLLSSINPSFAEFVDWVIIGQQTPPSKKTSPKIEWVQEIVEAADRAGVPVFLKNNLKPLFQPLMKVPNLSWWGNVFGLRQEMPK